MKAEKKTGGKCGASCKLQAARRVTWVGFWSNLGLSAAKIVAGVFGHSGAMIADGIHSLSDLASDLVVLVMVGISHKRPDREHPFGHGKYETQCHPHAGGTADHGRRGHLLGRVYEGHLQ